MFQEKRVNDFRLNLSAIVIVLLTILTVYLTTRLQATYANATELGKLHADVEVWKASKNASDKARDQLTEQLARTVWAGDPAVKTTEARRPSIMETWQANNDKAIKTRLTEIEYRLLKLESQERGR